MLASRLPDVVTLGCRLNLAESETIRGLLPDRDTIVVNTCGVTNEAVKQSRAAIRRARRDRPLAEIVVTGCAAEIDRAAFAAMPEVDRIVANAAKTLPASWGGFRNALPPRRHARAFVAVQNGCDHACTFCAIPAGRGPSRSEAVGSVVSRVAGLVDSGVREVVLTGVDLTSYEGGLGTLVEAILRDVPALSRLRLSSLDTIEIDDRLFDLVTGEPRVMPHLHLSLQAGDDLILKRMKRRHSRAAALTMINRLKARRDIAIGADLIAGFPTEDAAMFANTLALIDDADIVHAHIFPYSPRAGTPAARMPQVAPDLRRERAARLREAAVVRKAAWLRTLVGTTQEIVVEKPGDRGHSPGFAEVQFAFPSPALPDPARPEPVEGRDLGAALETRPSTGSVRTAGEIASVAVSHATPTCLIGTPA